MAHDLGQIVELDLRGVIHPDEVDVKTVRVCAHKFPLFRVWQEFDPPGTRADDNLWFHPPRGGGTVQGGQ